MKLVWKPPRLEEQMNCNLWEELALGWLFYTVLRRETAILQKKYCSIGVTSLHTPNDICCFKVVCVMFCCWSWFYLLNSWSIVMFDFVTDLFINHFSEWCLNICKHFLPLFITWEVHCNKGATTFWCTLGEKRQISALMKEHLAMLWWCCMFLDVHFCKICLAFK